MTPQELKDSIIQLALLGKVVEHIPSEGTGEEALKKAINTMHSARASFSNDDYTLDLPESWTWAKLSEITSDDSLNDGNWVLSKDMAINGPVKLIQLGSIGNCKYKDKGFKYLTEEHFHELNGRQIYSGYLLVNRLIGDRMLACILPPIDGILMTAVDVCWIAPNDEIYDLHYLMYALTSSDFQSKVKALGRGTTRFRISKLNLIDIAFPFPPLAEQKRIVAKIEELLPLIERYEKAWSRLEDFNKRFPGDMQKSILQMAIQGKLVEQRPEEGTGEELYREIQAEKQARILAGNLKKTKILPQIAAEDYPYDIPESWKICYIDDLAFVTKLAGFEYTKNIAPNLTSEGIPLFKGKNVQNGQVVLEFESFIPEEVSNELPRSQIRKKCLLTPYVGTIGNIAIFDGQFRAHLGSNVGKIELLNGDKQFVLEEYVLYYLRSQQGYAELTKFKKATAQESISIDAIRNVIIPLPPVAEQKRIVARVEELLPLCEKLK